MMKKFQKMIKKKYLYEKLPKKSIEILEDKCCKGLAISNQNMLLFSEKYVTIYNLESMKVISKINFGLLNKEHFIFKSITLSFDKRLLVL